MKLKDQNFEAGDEVVWISASKGPCMGEVTMTKWEDVLYTVKADFEGFDQTFLKQGIYLPHDKVQCLFHRDAVTIDEHGRLTAINHDYVKPRPKIVRQSACKFKPFEQVLLRDSNDQPWRKDLFDKRTDAHKPYVGLVLGKGWSQCIPFVGNERLDGVVTK